MRKLAPLFVSLVVLTNSFAQRTDHWTISVIGSYALPVGSLNSLFVGTSAYGFKIGRYTDKNFLWELKLELMRFTESNRNSLSPLVRDDLSLHLDVYGASVEGTYFLGATESFVQPYITGSAGMYRWFYTRGSHYAVAKDSAGNEVLDTAHYLDSFKQMDWSAGFSLGAGLGANLGPNFELYSDVRYKIIVGEIWQTLALGIDNVSAMQMAILSIGLRYNFW
ncbi:MAG: hypothetical protein ACP5JH_06635 [Bacteroidota bacterium]